MASIIQTPEFSSVDDSELCRRMEEGFGLEWKKHSDDEWETESSDTESKHQRRIRITKSRTLKLLEVVEKRRKTISSRISEKLRIVEDELENRCEKIAQLIEDWSNRLEKKEARKDTLRNPPQVQIFFEQEQSSSSLPSPRKNRSSLNDSSDAKKLIDETFDEISLTKLRTVSSSVDEDSCENNECFLEVKEKLNVALAQATQMNLTEEMRALFGAGAELNASNYCGFSPLCVAVLFGRCEALYALLEMGADPNHLSVRGWSPLHCAIARDNAEAVRILVNAGASLELAHPLTGESPLHFAASRGRKATTRALLQAGAQTNTRDLLGRTPHQVATTNTLWTILANDRETNGSPSCTNEE